MHTFTRPKPHFHGLASHVIGASRWLATRAKEWVMLRQIGWIAIAGLVGVLIWYISTDASFAPKVVAGAALALLGLLSGLRIGSQSAATYVSDVQRLNKVLADQNKELESANAILLKGLSAEFDPPARSQSA